MRVCVTDIDGSSMEDWVWSATERQVKDSAVAVLGLCQRELTPEELGSKYSTGWAFEKGSVRVFRLQPVDLPETKDQIRTLFEAKDTFTLVSPDFTIGDPIPQPFRVVDPIPQAKPDHVGRLIRWLYGINGAWR